MSKKLCFILLVVNTMVLVFLLQTFSYIFTSKGFHTKHQFKESYGFNSKESANIPEIYFNQSRIKKEFNNTCAFYPKIFDLKINNNYWQQEATSNGTFNFFNAYLDFRTTPPMVRILATFGRKDKNMTIFCQFWYSHKKEPIVVQSEFLFWMFNDKWGADNGSFEHPYLISCPVPKETPTSVSLVEKICDNATNNLKVFDHRSTKKKNFVVCVKGLSFAFEDRSIRLIEWIELLFLLGADKINFYEFTVHPRSKSVLNYYEKEGRVEVTPISLVGVSNTPQLQEFFLKTESTKRRLQEVVAYNDCLYKHVNTYKYVIPLDIDEVIFPAKNTWYKLIKILESADKQKSSYMAQNVYFFEKANETQHFKDIPEYMHMLQHIYRSRNHTKVGFYVKGFHKTEKVITLHNHHPLLCFGACESASIDVNVAQLQHYRSDCVWHLKKQCDSMKQETVKDARIWNFKTKLIKNTQKVMEELGFID